MSGFLKRVLAWAFSATWPLLLLTGCASGTPMEIAVDFIYSGEQYHRTFPATLQHVSYGFAGTGGRSWRLTPGEISVALKDGSILILQPNEWAWNKRADDIPFKDPGSSIETRVYTWIWLDRLPGATKALMAEDPVVRKPTGERRLIDPDNAVTATITRLKGGEMAAIEGSRKLEKQRLLLSRYHGPIDVGQGVFFAGVSAVQVIGVDFDRFKRLPGWFRREQGCRVLYSTNDTVRFIGEAFRRAHENDLAYAGNGLWEMPTKSTDLRQAFAISEVDVASFDFYDRKAIQRSVSKIKAGRTVCSIDGWNSNYAAVWFTDAGMMVTLGEARPRFILRDVAR